MGILEIIVLFVPQPLRTPKEAKRLNWSQHESSILEFIFPQNSVELGRALGHFISALIGLKRSSRAFYLLIFFNSFKSPT